MRPTNTQTRTRAPRKRSGGLFPKKTVRDFLTRDGKKHGITKTAFVSFLSMLYAKLLHPLTQQHTCSR